MKFVIITFIVIFTLSSTIRAKKSLDNSHDNVSNIKGDSLDSKTKNLEQIENKANAKVSKYENSKLIAGEKIDSKNLKQNEVKFNTLDNNKSSTKLKSSLTKNSSQKVELKKSLNDEIYYAKCFIRFGNDFYDMSKIPEININADTENGNKDFKINMCKDIGTSCSATGLGIQEKDCIVIAGDQKVEKSWIADGKFSFINLININIILNND